MKSLTHVVIAVLLCVTQLATAAETTQPNFVIIFTDDQGYGDLSCFGGQHVNTPRIDQMAAEGSRLTNFYVAAPVCTPSRAALMTGCYPKRIDMATGSNFVVLLAGDTKGLNPDEITIAEVLKTAGYKTGIFGKWHLGDQPEFLPTKQGFDEYFGIPFSHDIHPFHPRQDHFKFPPLALLENESVIEMDPNADFLTKRITEHAVSFIQRNKDEPFFLYVPHPIPHKPLHVSPPFIKGVDPAITVKLNEEKNSIDYKTRDKLFRQAIDEIDWSVGQILDTLKEQGLDENTLVIFTSDNGPAVGSAGPLRGRKGSTFEGGMRESTVIRWPGKIPAGEFNDEIMTTMDLLPTFAKLAGAEIPTDRVIDGKDIWPTLRGAAATPHETFFYHRGNTLSAVRCGKWKLHTNNGRPAQLYDLQSDIGEKNDVIKSHPEVVRRLSKYLTDFEKDIAANSRPAAFVKTPKPLTMASKLSATGGDGFADDVAFMRKHTEIVLLHEGGAAVAVAPAYQGRVMTSTFDGEAGPSFGWINRPVIEHGFLSDEGRKGKLEEHIYIFGGEERFWLGPEGGQFALFFKPGTKFEFSDWATPPVIDTEAFKLVEQTDASAKFERATKLVNYSGTEFNVGIQRTVKLLDKVRSSDLLGVKLDGLRMVAYETDNRITNTGSDAWNQKTGLLSIWILGMYNPSPETTVVIPFKPGDDEQLGPKVNDTYFGKVPPEYLKVEDQRLFFRGDGTRRGKIGIPPRRSMGIAGSYDADGKVLNIVTYNVQNAPDGFVNSMWELQDEPYAGDVINSYNDGSPEPGVAPLGPFYELETSSPAAALKPGETMKHIQRTFHIQGSEKELDPLAMHLLGVHLDAIKSAF